MVKRLIISTAAFADIDRIIAFNDERNFKTSMTVILEQIEEDTLPTHKVG